MDLPEYTEKVPGMISQEEFLKIFEDCQLFSGEELGRVYKAVVDELTVLYFIPKQAWPEILKAFESVLWPFLRRIDDPDLCIYRGIDPAWRDQFIEKIHAAKELRRKAFSETAVFEFISDFFSIFNYTKKDLEKCKERAREREPEIARRRKFERTVRYAAAVAVGAGAATAGYKIGKSLYNLVKEKKK